MDTFLWILAAISILLLVLYLYWVFAPTKRNQYRASILFKEVKPDQTWHDSINIEKMAGRYLRKNKEKLQELIDRSGVRTTPQKIVTEQVVYPILVLIVGAVFSFVFNTNWILIFSGGLALFFIFEPKSKLNKKIKEREYLIRKETPNFALSVRLLCRAKTPVEAMKLACKHASDEGLKSFTEELYSDLDHMNPAEAVRKFGWSTSVGEMIEFSTAMSQYMEVGPTKDGQEILQQMETTFRELDKKILEQEKEVRPKKLKGINFVLFANGVFFIMAALLLYLAQLLTGGFA